MEIIDQVRQAANIVDIASLYTTLKKRGAKHVGLCPFHAEKNPSFTVDEDKQLFHCFGCGTGGDVFTMVMEKESLSFPEALRFLAERYNIRLPEKRRLSPQLVKLEEQLYKVCEEALAFFKKNLHNTQEGDRALDYLKNRGLSSKLVQDLKIGYAMNSWDSLIQSFSYKKVSPSILEKAGLVLRRQNREGFYDRFRARIMFPIFTLIGKVVAFGGRTVIDADPKYLNSPDTPIYTKGNLLYGLNFSKAEAREMGEIILVEGYTDLLALYQAGIPNAAASLGTSLTEHQVALAARFAPRLMICFDGDAAGRKAAERAVSLCFEKSIQSRVVILPENTDPDSYIRSKGQEAFKKLAGTSIPGLRFLIDTKLRQTSRDIPEEKARIARDMLQEIQKIPDSVVRSEYLKQTSEYLGIEESDLRAMIRRKVGDREVDQADMFLPAEQRLLQILLSQPSLAGKVFSEMRTDDIQGLKSAPVFLHLQDRCEQGNALVLHELKQIIMPPLFAALSKIMLENGHEATLEEALDCLYALRQVSLERQSKELNREIARLEKQGEKDKALSLLNHKLDLARELALLSQRNF